MPKKKTFLAGHAGVDAGLILIGDPGYVIEPSGDAELEGGWDEFVSRVFDGEYKAEGEVPDVATEPLGTRSGIVIKTPGDGIYPVYVTLDASGQPESATIVFNEQEFESEG
jgi:hypothetical protein